MRLLIFFVVFFCSLEEVNKLHLGSEHCLFVHLILQILWHIFKSKRCVEGYNKGMGLSVMLFVAGVL
jgi:hypothetical protein